MVKSGAEKICKACKSGSATDNWKITRYTSHLFVVSGSTPALPFALASFSFICIFSTFSLIFLTFYLQAYGTYAYTHICVCMYKLLAYIETNTYMHTYKYMQLICTCSGWVHIAHTASFQFIVLAWLVWTWSQFLRVLFNLLFAILIISFFITNFSEASFNNPFRLYWRRYIDICCCTPQRD